MNSVPITCICYRCNSFFTVPENNCVHIATIIFSSGVHKFTVCKTCAESLQTEIYTLTPSTPDQAHYIPVQPPIQSQPPITHIHHYHYYPKNEPRKADDPNIWYQPLGPRYT